MPQLDISTLLITILSIFLIKTIDLFIQLVALGIGLTANAVAGHLLILLMTGATLVLINISTTTALTTFIIHIFLTIVEFAVVNSTAYIFMLMYLPY